MTGWHRAGGGIVPGVDMPKIACSDPRCDGQVASRFKARDHPLDGPFILAAFLCNMRDGWPAITLVISVVRQREKNKFVAVGKGDFPNHRHDADAHSQSALHTQLH